MSAHLLALMLAYLAGNVGPAMEAHVDPMLGAMLAYLEGYVGRS